jgi:HAD superfamily hydrolase (TIGR01484 family)
MLRPIAEIDERSCQQLLGVVFDVDDTLTRGGRVERVAYDALWRLRDAGLLLVAVTGRPLGFAEIIARTWPVDIAVGENGAGYLRVHDHQLRAGFFHDAAERKHQREILERVRTRIAHEAPWAELTDDSWGRRCDIAYDVAERAALPSERVDVLRALIAEEGARSVVSSVHIHAMVGDYDKAQGVVHACRSELGHDPGQDRSRWLFVGDSGNDAPAFSYFPLSAGVANVRDHLAMLPTPPAFVSQADRGAGFAEIATTILERRR